MKIALFGSGKMSAAVRASLRVGDSVTPLEEADVCIDFSHHSAVLSNVQRAMKQGCPIVVGTTGWDAKKQDIVSCVEDARGSLLYGANFSRGVFLFSRIIQRAAFLLRGYDRAGIESHHSSKVDAPSGTAKELSRIVNECSNGENLLEFSSIRIGNVLGTHTVYFDSVDETIEITHRAKGKGAYALGAIQAAAWLKNRRGIYTFEDYMEQQLQCKSQEHSLQL